MPRPDLWIRLAVPLTALAFVCMRVGILPATDYLVSSATEVSTALKSAGPGDTLLMTDGVWTNQHISFAGFGTATNPITLRAQHPGEVLLNGSSTLSISGDWLEVDGLRFEGGALGAGDHVVEFRGVNGEATNSRFTNSAIIDYNPTDVNTRYFWVSLYGQHNRVDHNRFEGQNHSGVTVTVWRDDTNPDYHLIDGNYFVDRPEPINPASSNGFETIRIGTSDESLSNSFTVVENNLFDRVDGEIEIISNKSGGNIYRYNTFRESKGTLTLRHGNDTLVEGNFFLGQNKNGSGAIRVIGERQTIVNNYIANVDDRAGGAISISAGVPNSELNQYYQVKDAVIAHNTIVNTLDTMMTFDDGFGSSGRSLLAENVTVANNLFRSSGPRIFEGTEGANWVWEGNLAFGGSLGPKAGAPGIAEADPLLQLSSDGLWRLSSMSPAINNAFGDYSSLIVDDMDGQPRIGLFDIGADEYSELSIVRKPLQAGDVGPGWISPPDPNPGGGGGCFANGCAIQAEDYSALLDPNGDGLVWTTITDDDALGGEALQAPAGARVNLPADLHDTVAVYDLTFSQPGTYRAYYRAEGFDGSSDSLYVPDDFDVDPDNPETTSNNGAYRWETGTTFTISSSNVDVPLEFRVGRREQTTVLDAIVLDVNLALTPAELDALFMSPFAAGDFDEDADVDSDDLAVWQMHFGSSTVTHLEGDADADGDVDGRDYLVWQRDYTASGMSPMSSQQVPEPTGIFPLLFATPLSHLTIRNRTSSVRFRKGSSTHA